MVVLKILVFLIMIGIVGDAVNKIRSLLSDKNIDKDQHSKKIEQSIYQILGAIICCWFIIAISADKNTNNFQSSSAFNTASIPFSDRKFLSSKAEEAYNIIWKSLNEENSLDIDITKHLFENIPAFENLVQKVFDKLSPSERIEVFTALFDKMSKNQQATLSAHYKSAQEVRNNTSQRLVLYLNPMKKPMSISEQELSNINRGIKYNIISARLYPQYTSYIAGKIGVLGKMAYQYEDIRNKFYQKFENIIASDENKIATKFQSFYKNFDNKSEKEQFYFCSGIAIASPDINNPPIIRPRDVPVDYVGLMQIYKNQEVVQLLMKQNEETLIHLNNHTQKTMMSRATQYFGWGGIQYGPLTDSELDIVDTGRLAAYFDIDIRNDKQLADKCNVIFNKMSNQSGETLETKGSAYINRLMTKYNQSEIRYYFTENQYLQQGSSLYGLYLSMSKPVYERNENIVLSVKWNEDNANCEILTDKIKEALTKNQFEIVENGISCSKDTATSNVKLTAKIKTSKLGKISIPSIELDDDFSNSVDFTVKDTEALREALNTKNINAVKDVLSAPEDLNKIKIDGKSPVAHFIKDDTDFAKELIKLGASPNEIDENGYTPLMYAVIRQDNELLDLLLDKNVYLNELDKKGRTAIMYAAIKNNIYAAKKLVKHKADIYKSKDGKWSAYLYAQEMKHMDIAELLKSNKDRMVLIIDKCDACKAKEKIFLEQIGKLYPTLQKAVIKETPDDDRDSTKHSGNFNYPFVKIGDKATLDKDITNAYRPDHRLDKWDGTEKHLEQIMYKD